MVSKQHDEAGPSRIALSKKKGLPELLGRVISTGRNGASKKMYGLRELIKLDEFVVK